MSFFLFTASIHGNDYVAPSAIKSIFTQMFPEAEDVLWEKWGREVVAIFRDWKGLKKAFFTEQGIWLETREKLKTHQLPIYVQTTLYESYPNMEVTYAGKIYRPQEIIYRVESESEKSVIVKLFEESGTLISEKVIRFSIPQSEVLPMLPRLKPRINNKPKSVLNVE